MLLLLTADHDDVRLDFIVAGDCGTEVSPLSINLNMLVERELGLCQGIVLFGLILRNFPSDPISNVENFGRIA